MKLKTALWMGAILVALTLVPAGILFYQNQKLKGQVAEYAGQLDINYKALTKSLQQAETKLAKNDDELDAFAEQRELDLKTIKNNLKSLDAYLVAVASSEAKTSTVVNNHYISNKTTSSEIEVPLCKDDGRPIDIYSYTKNIETTRLEDSNGMVIADVSFSAAQKRPWSSKVFGLSYLINNTIGEGPGGQVILTTELLAENPEVQSGELFRIDGFNSRLLQAPTSPPEFDWWDPSLFLTTQLGLGVYQELQFSAGISVGFSPFSYGNLKVLGVSIGYDAFNNTFLAALHPILYNVGAHIPLISDLFVSLYCGIDSNTSVSIGIGISTML